MITWTYLTTASDNSFTSSVLWNQTALNSYVSTHSQNSTANYSETGAGTTISSVANDAHTQPGFTFFASTVVGATTASGGISDQNNISTTDVGSTSFSSQENSAYHSANSYYATTYYSQYSSLTYSYSFNPIGNSSMDTSQGTTTGSTTTSFTSAQSTFSQITTSLSADTINVGTTAPATISYDFLNSLTNFDTSDTNTTTCTQLTNAYVTSTTNVIFTTTISSSDSNVQNGDTYSMITMTGVIPELDEVLWVLSVTDVTNALSLRPITDICYSTTGSVLMSPLASLISNTGVNYFTTDTSVTVTYVTQHVTFTTVTSTLQYYDDKVRSLGTGTMVVLTHLLSTNTSTSLADFVTSATITTSTDYGSAGGSLYSQVVTILEPYEFYNTGYNTITEVFYQLVANFMSISSSFINANQSYNSSTQTVVVPVAPGIYTYIVTDATLGGFGLDNMQPLGGTTSQVTNGSSSYSTTFPPFIGDGYSYSASSSLNSVAASGGTFLYAYTYLGLILDTPHFTVYESVAQPLGGRPISTGPLYHSIGLPFTIPFDSITFDAILSNFNSVYPKVNQQYRPIDFNTIRTTQSADTFYQCSWKEDSISLTAEYTTTTGGGGSATTSSSTSGIWTGADQVPTSQTFFNGSEYLVTGGYAPTTLGTGRYTNYLDRVTLSLNPGYYSFSTFTTFFPSVTSLTLSTADYILPIPWAYIGRSEQTSSSNYWDTTFATFNPALLTVDVRSQYYDT